VKTLAVLSQKGGAGKTTLAVHLAVMAQAEGQRVLIVDADPQRSASGWWQSREAGSPELVEAPPGQARAILQAARAAGHTLALVDTAPHSERSAGEVAGLAELAIIPCRPGILDLRAIGSTADIVRAARTPAAIVLNACPPGRGGEARLAVEARSALQAYGVPLAPVSVTQRAALAHALIDGRAVQEFEPDGRAAAEIRALWEWIRGKLWQSAHH
jgi:chromosome partitioning protein